MYFTYEHLWMLDIAVFDVSAAAAVAADASMTASVEAAPVYV